MRSFGVGSMNAKRMCRLVERLTKTVQCLEELLDQADAVLVELEQQLEEMEEEERSHSMRMRGFRGVEDINVAEQ